MESGGRMAEMTGIGRKWNGFGSLALFYTYVSIVP